MATTAGSARSWATREERRREERRREERATAGRLGEKEERKKEESRPTAGVRPEGGERKENYLNFHCILETGLNLDSTSDIFLHTIKLLVFCKFEFFEARNYFKF